jgi:TetR/AcrR family transcriptional regulator
MSEPGQRRGEQTREAILAAAEAAFAEHGFAGARIDAIAAEVGHSKNLIFRYFGDKLGLYVAVLRRFDQEADGLLARLFAPLLEDETATSNALWFRSFLETLVQTAFDYIVAHPRFMRILNWEMAQQWQTFTRIASQFPREVTDQFETLFQRARKAGLLRSGFVPAIQLMTALQMCQSSLAFLPFYQALLADEDISSPAALARVREYIVAFIVAGMMVDPKDGKAGELRS